MVAVVIDADAHRFDELTQIAVPRFENPIKGNSVVCV